MIYVTYIEDVRRLRTHYIMHLYTKVIVNVLFVDITPIVSSKDIQYLFILEIQSMIDTIGSVSNISMDVGCANVKSLIQLFCLSHQSHST